MALGGFVLSAVRGPKAEGLLYLIHSVEPQDHGPTPGSRPPRLGPRAFSVSVVSKIENGQMSPTYEALKKLAIGLEISVPQLFTPPEQGQVGGRMAVTKSGEGNATVTVTYEHELLAETLTQKKMLPYRARVRARSMDEFDGWVRHDGEEFMYVLTGVVQLYTEFYEPVEMRRGDSAYYDATMGHNVVSLSDEDASILWVTSLN